MFRRMNKRMRKKTMMKRKMMKRIKSNPRTMEVGNTIKGIKIRCRMQRGKSLTNTLISTFLV